MSAMQSRPMKDSGVEWIGEIPQEWHTGKICYASERLFLGKTPEYAEEENNNLTLGQKNNQAYGIDLKGIKYSTDKHLESCNSYEFLKYGDILLNSL